MSEDEVPSFGRFVVRKAGLGYCFVGRFAVSELTESPAAGCGVLSRILDQQAG
jgi:hypothetical protein